MAQGMSPEDQLYESLRGEADVIARQYLNKVKLRLYSLANYNSDHATALSLVANAIDDVLLDRDR